MKSKLVIIAFLCCIILVTATLFLTGCQHAQTKKPAAKPIAHITSVDAEITNIDVSPDSSRVGLILQKKVSGKIRYSVAMFDITSRKILGTSHATLAYNPALAWSPDNRWLAILDAKNSVLLMDRNGRAERIKLSRDVDELIWRGDHPDRFICRGVNTDSKPFYALEWDVTHHRERTIPLKHPAYMGFFIVKGRPCICYDEGLYPYKDPVLHIVDAETDKELFKVPIPRRFPWDIAGLETSPDGRYFYLSAYYSGDNCDIIARVEDADIVLKEPLKAVMWQYNISGDISGINWLQTPMGRDLSEREFHQVVVNAGLDNDLPFILNLDTGSRNETITSPESFPKKYPIIRVWKPETLMPSFFCDFIAVSRRGLEFCSENDDPPPTLILKHKMMPKKKQVL